MLKKLMYLILITVAIMITFIIPAFAELTGPDGLPYESCTVVRFAGNLASLGTRRYYNLNPSPSNPLEPFETPTGIQINHYLILYNDGTYSRSSYCINTTLKTNQFSSMNTYYNDTDLLNGLHEMVVEINPEYLEYHSEVEVEEFGRVIVPITLPSGKMIYLNPYLDNLKTKIKDWLKPKVDEFKTGAVDWIGQKVDKFKNSLILGTDLIFNAGSIMRLKMAKLYEDPLDDEYIEDENNGVSDELDLVMQLDTFIRRVENTENYDVEIYNHDTGYRIGYITVPAQYNSETGNYYIEYDIDAESIPSYRGIYQYENHGVVWDSANNTWNVDIVTLFDKGITDTGFYVIGTKSEVEKATGQTFPDVPDDEDDTEVPEDNTEVVLWLQNIFNKINDIFDYLVNDTEDSEGNYNNYFDALIYKLNQIFDSLKKEETDDPQNFGVLNWLENIYQKMDDILESITDISTDENGKPQGFLGLLNNISGIASNLFDLFDVDGVIGSALTGIGQSVGNAVGDALDDLENLVDKFEIPVGFGLGLPKLFLLVGGVLIALIGVILKFIVFIGTLWNVQPTNELLSPEMIQGLEYVRNISIPVFGNLSILTLSLLSVITGFIIIETIRRNEVNG